MRKKQVLQLKTCCKCGWVHFGLLRKEAKYQVKQFNEFYDKLSKKEQKEYYGNHKANIEIYEQCNVCGNSYKNFRNYRKGDCPPGVTIGPIIYELKKKK
jgi:hypothetical protein